MRRAEYSLQLVWLISDVSIRRRYDQKNILLFAYVDHVTFFSLHSKTCRAEALPDEIVFEKEIKGGPFGEEKATKPSVQYLHPKTATFRSVLCIHHLFVLGVGLHHEAQINLRLQLLKGEIRKRHAIPAMNILVLVLCRSVDDQESVKIHQDAAASGPFALAVVLRRRKDGKHLHDNGEHV